ncbi:MAG: POTRA domain-containing protein, partial [Thermodesulfovibrionales bacterium]
MTKDQPNFHVTLKSITILVMLIVAFSFGQVNAYERCARIENIDITGIHTVSEDEIRSLLDIKVGMPLDKRAVSSSIKRLFLKDIFRDIIVEMQETGEDNCRLRINLVEKMIIDSTNINTTSLSPSFIKRHIRIDTGERVNETAITNAIVNLQSIVRHNGYPMAKVQYRLTPKGKIKVQLDIDIDEGDPETIKKIVLDDPSGIVERFLTFKVGGYFSQEEMQRLERQIRGYLRKNMYIQTPIKHTFINGVLGISFRLGKKINIKISGNEQISTGTILKEIPMMEVRSLNQELIEELTKRIEFLYRQRGYIFVQVLPTIEETEDEILINFYIYEGIRYLIKNIVFKGNSIPDDRLIAIMSQRINTTYNRQLFDEDIQSIREFYYSIGYLDVVIEYHESEISEGGVELSITINEGKVYQVDEIEIVGNSIFTSDEIVSWLTIKVGDPLNDIEISNSRRKIIERYRKLGFANVQVNLKKEAPQGKHRITFFITEGEVLLFGKTVFRGNIRTKNQVLVRELLHREGDFFQGSILLQERQRLYRTGLFSDIEMDVSDPYVSIYEGEHSIRYVDVVYTVNEAPAGSTEFGLGYGEYERFRGFLEISYKNLMGMNRQGALRTEISNIEKRYILSYFDPWFFGENLPLKGLLLHERKLERSIDTREVRYRLKRTTASLGIDRRLAKEFNVEFYCGA